MSGLLKGAVTAPVPKTPLFAVAPDGGPSAPAGTTTPSPSGAPPGGGGAPGAYTPDWAKLIAGDAGLTAAQAALAGSATADQNALGGEFTNAYESFGKPVDLSALAQQLGMSQADIQAAMGPDAQRIAQENTDAGTSTVARLDQANKNATRQIIANLNKRGLLHSGETGYQLDQQNLGYRQAQTDAYSKFLSYLQQYQQGYLTAQQQRAAALSSAYSTAADRQYNLNQGSGATSSVPPAAAAGGQSDSGQGGGKIPVNYEDLIAAMQTPEAVAARARGQRGEFTPLT